jgi:eukaryotic-like serine/threonine-protein kinase
MLSPGSKLGSYEVVAPLGAGGMGEVWRAHDTRLGRDVAVKVLPPALATDGAAGARFEREARAVAALAHPNVLSIFDFGREDGLAYAVMELLEGATLRETLVGRALSPRRAVEVAREIALGLGAAHERGIVHRDLKPENVFVTKDGRVKILDFGLAKETSPAGGSGSQLATVDQQTEPGTVLGTVGYMSPEQVRGLPVDARTDVFALGAILYEMLAGRRAFTGASSADTMSAILREDPPELGGEARPVSPSLERVVRRCLEKSPDQRFRSAADVAFALDAISVSTAIERTAAVEAPRTRRRLISTALALALAAAVAGAFVLGRRTGGRPAPRFRRLTFQRGFVSNARFAPDGATVVYTAGWEGEPWKTYSTRVDAKSARSLDLPPSTVTSISKSGEIALLLRTMRVRLNGTLATAPLAGGAPRPLAENVSTAAFLPDGSLAASRCTPAACTLEVPLGRAVYSTQANIGALAPSPDGKTIALLEWDSGEGKVRTIDLSSGKPRTLVAGLAAIAPGLVWRGGEIWYGGTPHTTTPAIWAVDARGRSRRVLQVPTAVNFMDIAADGRVLMNSTTWRTALMVGTSERPAEADLSWMDWSTVKDISTDGRSVLFDETREAAGRENGVWIRTTDGAPAVRLGDGIALSLSPDGKQALALLSHLNPPELAVWPTGPGTPLSIKPESGLLFLGGRFFPDGKRILVVAHAEGKPPRLYTLDLPSGKPHAFTEEVLSGWAISPDGAFVAGGTLDGKLALFPVSGGAPRIVPGLSSSVTVPRFTADGRSLYAYTRGEFPLRVLEVDVQTGAQKVWKELLPSDLSGVTALTSFQVTPDGRSYAYAVQHHFSDLYVVEGLE